MKKTFAVLLFLAAFPSYAQQAAAPSPDPIVVAAQIRLQDLTAVLGAVLQEREQLKVQVKTLIEENAKLKAEVKLK